ncbi:hypothetical protein A5320_03925 [Rheinheimera sp. SA_1]|uniref:hypothetical protein n=1 Tax=Rheinheimera sp. SA_1 TaxID=1827365 RepID=UPI0007FBA52D|nr:hypothetical protein [Rheinheimera sp. SA_1]OBP16554.1 hypothetical protein A5320_03925 [Rheinheimera sp. SA_1]
MTVGQHQSDNSYYSNLFAELAALLQNNASLAHLAFDDANSSISDFISDFRYNVSPWPVVIDERIIRCFSRVVESMPSVFSKVLRYYYQHDPQWVCQYLGISELMLQRFGSQGPDTADLMCRYDAIMAGQQLKLVELNVGSSLGGWWSDWLYPEIRQVLDHIGEVKHWNHKYRRISENTFKAVWQSIWRLKGFAAQGNVFIYLPATATANLQRVHDHLYQMVMLTRPEQYPNATLTIFNDLDNIEWLADGNIAWQGTVMDTLLLPIVKGDELPISFQAKLQGYSEKNKFYYPDSERLTLLSVKMLFALLHEPRSRQILSDAEWQLVEDHIPWSAKLAQPTVSYHGQIYPTKTFVSDQQQQLVFKKSRSMQGKDVLVGHSVPAADWIAFYQQHQQDPDWLIQQYCAPDLVASADQRSGFNSYRMVWGIFGFDNRYAGAWCRGVPAAHEDTVINLARGAVEFVVTEQQPQKLKMTL